MLDRTRVMPIVNAAMGAIQRNYHIGPQNRERVFEALNALAGCVAHVVSAPDSDSGRRECQAFFLEALEHNCAEVHRRLREERDGTAQSH